MELKVTPLNKLHVVLPTLLLQQIGRHFWNVPRLRIKWTSTKFLRLKNLKTYSPKLRTNFADARKRCVRFSLFGYYRSSIVCPAPTRYAEDLAFLFSSPNFTGIKETRSSVKPHVWNLKTVRGHHSRVHLSGRSSECDLIYDGSITIGRKWM